MLTFIVPFLLLCIFIIFSAFSAVSVFSVFAAAASCPPQPTDVVQFWHKGDSGLLETYLTDTPTTNKAILSAYTSYYLDCGTGTWVTTYFLKE